MSIRPPAACGMFYPKESDKLLEFVNYAIGKSANFDKKPLILVSPHAGFIYSGYTAGYAFRQLQNLDQDREYKVLLLGPSHRVYLESAALSPNDGFETPLGVVKVDQEESQRLMSRFSYITVNPAPHKLEHSLETQLPFLQAALKSFSIIPLVYGAIADEKLFETLEEFLIDESRIVVISSDLSHYYHIDEANFIDSHCIKGIERLSFAVMKECEACGKPAILAAIRYAIKHNLKAKTLDYKTSADTAGDKNKVVGYGSFMFYKEEL